MKQNYIHFDSENQEEIYDYLSSIENNDDYEFLWDEIDSTAIGGGIFDPWEINERKHRAEKQRLKKAKKKKDQKTTKPENQMVLHIDLQMHGDLDGQSETKFRKEQSLFRKQLLGGRSEAECVICGCQYPENALWTAHIKKRCHADQDEKRDINIVALMCRVGCDYFFEEGHIAVIEGEIIRGKYYKATTNDMRLKIDPLIGRKCLIYGTKNKRYFKWHALHHSL